MHIILFMTRGMSLAAWEKNGSLERELALYAELAQYGCKTTIISWGGKYDKIIANRYPWLKVCANTWNLSQQRYEQLMPILHAAHLLQADLIKSNQTNGADCAWRCARLWKKPFIARCGYIWSQFCKKMNSDDLHISEYIEKEVYTNCNIGIVTTEESRQFIEQKYNISKEKIEVIPNYVSNSYYKCPLPRYASGKKHIITQVGRLVDQKNLFSLIKACIGLSVTLRLIGDGPLKKELQQYAKQHGVTVEFTGTVTTAELPCLLGESTIVTLVSHYEGHPKTLIEAMARGCAVLGTDVQGIAPLIKHEINGLLCTTSPTAIRAGLERLIKDESLRERIGQQARRDAQQFCITNIARRELAVYQRLPRETAFQKCSKVIAIVFSSMPKLIKKLYKKFFRSIDKRILSLAMRMIRLYIRRKTPADSLRLLFNLEAELYSLEGQSAVAYDGGVHTKHRHTRYHDFFIARLRPGEYVLDIGCGNGFLAYDIASRAGARVTGIELQAENIAIARQRFAHPQVEFIQGDALKDLPADSFETVILSNVLEHLPGRVDFLRKVQERLRPRRFLLRVPLFERDWRVPLKKELGVEWRLDSTHEIEYTQEQFACELACAGLYITDFQIRWSEIWCEARADVPYVQERSPSPQITVLMSVHNGEKYLETAINSILRQTLRDFDFLIIDDASTDASSAILSDFARKDARIQILTNERNLGLAASLNRGISQIKTPYIARMDADDIAAPQRLEEQLAYMERNPNLCASGTWITQFTQDTYLHIYEPATNPQTVRERTLFNGPQIMHPTAMIRTEAIKAINGYDEAFLCAQDYDLWLRLLDYGDLANIPKSLLFYRIHETSTSSTKIEQQVINHFIALRKSEMRFENKICNNIRSHSWETVFSLLDPQTPSFYVILSLLIHRNISNKSEKISMILNKISYNPQKINKLYLQNANITWEEVAAFIPSKINNNK